MKSPLDEFGYFYLILESIVYDVNETSLTILVSCARESENIYRANPAVDDETEIIIERLQDASRQIISDENSPRYRICFEETGFYQVSDEFDYDMSKEKCDDKGVIGIVEESSLLRHLKTDTGLFWRCENSKLYVVATSDSWLRVVSSKPPKVTLEVGHT